MLAATGLTGMTSRTVMNLKTAGARPKGYSCLAFCCDGGDKGFKRHILCNTLIAYRAELESRDESGNTPFLLASGAGITNVMRLLAEARADVHATNNVGCGAAQKAAGHSGDMLRALSRVGVQVPEELAPSGRQRHTVSENRQARYARDDRHYEQRQALGYRDRGYR